MADNIESVRALYLRALRVPAEERAVFLAAHAGELRGQIEALLRQEEAPTLLDVPPLAPILAALDAAATRVSVAHDGIGVGDRVGGFVITGLVARGSRSTVWCAEQTNPHREVALKVIAAVPGDTRARTRFQRQATILAGISARHLVPVYAAGEDPERGLLWCAMRLVRGPDLAAVLTDLRGRGAPPRGELQRALVARCTEVARGLAALHGHGLVHRDVKPANIVLDGGDREQSCWSTSSPAVLVDLDLVRPAIADAGLSTDIGTLLYVAPEVWRREAVGPEADVYGLGLVLWDLLSGRDPARRAPGVSPPRLRGVVPQFDADLDAIVAMATAPLPRWRYPSGASLAADLEAWLSGSKVAARRVGTLRHATRWVRRHPAEVLRALGFIAAAAIVLGLAAAGGIGAINTLSVLRSVRAAWSDGNLVAFQSGLRDLPTFLTLALPTAAQDALEPAGDPANSAIAAVLAAIEERDELAGLDVAARYLQRDGLQGHPCLAAYLLHTLRASDPRNQQAVAVTARLFLEQPDTSPADTAASTRFCDALLQQLGAGPWMLRDDRVLTALAGCGGPMTVRALLEWVARGPPTQAMIRSESLRLACLATAAIVTRAGKCGFAAGLLECIDDRMLTEAAAAVVRGSGWRPTEYMHPGGALCELGIAMALLRRAHGRPGVVSALAGLDPLPWALRAAQGDSSVRDHIIALGSQRSGDSYTVAYEAGLLAGLSDEQVVREAGRAAVVMYAEHRLWTGNHHFALFDRGCADGDARRSGWAPYFQTDARSHLSQMLTSAPPARELSVIARPAGVGELAGWDCTCSPIGASGTAGAVRVSGVEVREDELSPASCYLLLADQRSRIQLPFSARGEVADYASVRIVLQKSARSLLPRGGRIELGLVLDGLPIAEGIVVDAASQQSVVVPLPRLERGLEHAIAIGLRPGSDTTLRVLSVSVGVN